MMELVLTVLLIVASVNIVSDLTKPFPTKAKPFEKGNDWRVRYVPGTLAGKPVVWRVMGRNTVVGCKALLPVVTDWSVK